MWDYDYLQEMSKGIEHIIKYGTTNTDIEGSAIKSEPFLVVNITKGSACGTIHTNLVGDYNLPNVLAAVAAGKYFGVPDAAIKQAVENYTPSNSRSQLVEKGTNKIILDAYNANPSSMRLAIENLAKIDAENKVLILGAMAELGNESLQEHKEIVELIKNHSWKAVVLVGGDFLRIDHPFVTFATANEAKDWLKKQNFEYSHMLIKGSRSMQMENVLDN